MPFFSFKCPDASAANLLRLVAAYGRCADEPTINIGSADVVEFADDSGNQLTGAITACRFIASKCADPAALLGDSAEQQAKIFEWLTFALTDLTPLLDDKLVILNDWMLTRTFLAGAKPSLADIVVYAAVSPAACGFPVAQHKQFCNLLRWYDHINALVDSTGLFPAAKFQKAKFVLPPPPLAAAAKPAKASAAATDGKVADKAAPDTASTVSNALTADAKKDKKKDKKATGGPATPAVSASNDKPAASKSTAASASDGPLVDVLDFRVGQIVSVGPHPNADSLYVEEIDLGEDKTRTVVSGLRKFVSIENMQNRRVVVVTNLKPAKMRDVMSYGMVLCASNDDHTAVDPINPPEGVPVGEKITFEGYNAEPEAVINPKKKIFEKIAPDLVTDDGGVCTYRGVPFMTTKGPVTATMPGAHIA